MKRYALAATAFAACLVTMTACSGKTEPATGDDALSGSAAIKGDGTDPGGKPGDPTNGGGKGEPGCGPNDPTGPSPPQPEACTWTAIGDGSSCLAYGDLKTKAVAICESQKADVRSLYPADDCVGGATIAKLECCVAGSATEPPKPGDPPPPKPGDPGPPKK